MGLAGDGRGRSTAPFKLSDQLHHIPESTPYEKDSQRRIPAKPRNWLVSAHWSKVRALKAAIFLPETSKSACACCESPVCHAWGQPSMEQLIRELFMDWHRGLMTEKAVIHCTSPQFHVRELQCISASHLRLYSEKSCAGGYKSTLLF